MSRTRVRRPLLALLVLLVALGVGYTVRATHHDSSHPSSQHTSTRSSNAPVDGEVALSSLPPQAAATVKLIEAGGPFPYPRNDGVVFRNSEHRLPIEPAGYYHEYTVPTPGVSNRGTRRIITGKNGQFYYTADHYEHFVRVDVDS